jgi:hypothetical protein
VDDGSSDNSSIIKYDSYTSDNTGSIIRNASLAGYDAINESHFTEEFKSEIETVDQKVNQLNEASAGYVAQK